MILDSEKLKQYETFQEQSVQLLYDFYYPHRLDQPSACCAWGEVTNRQSNFQRQNVVFGTRSEAEYNEKLNIWYGLSSLIVESEIDIPNQGQILAPNPNLSGSKLAQDQIQIVLDDGLQHQTHQQYAQMYNMSGNSHHHNHHHHQQISAGHARNNLHSQNQHGPPPILPALSKKIMLLPDGSGPRRIEIKKVLVHPGEINSLKAWQCNQKILASLSDSKKVFVWNLNNQTSVREKQTMPANQPDLVLEGHEGVTDYALAWSDKAPLLASGGKDCKVLLWDLSNFIKKQGLDRNGKPESSLKSESEEVDFHHSDERNCSQKDAQSSQQTTSRVKMEEVEERQSISQYKDINSENSPKGSKIKERRTVKSDKRKSVKQKNKELDELADYLNLNKKVVKKSQGPFAKLCGHTGSVEDVTFKPQSQFELCSVGIDRKILFWDTRQRGQQNQDQQLMNANQKYQQSVQSQRNQKVQQIGPSMILNNVHLDDINTVDWSPMNEFLIATGSNDKLVKIVDIRKLSSQPDAVTKQFDLKVASNQSDMVQSPIVNTFQGHKEPVQQVQFCPFDSRYIISASDSVKIWDLNSKNEDEKLFFDHIGHKNMVTDAQWNIDSPWSIMSVSDDMTPFFAGPSLQFYRPTELLTTSNDNEQLL